MFRQRLVRIKRLRMNRLARIGGAVAMVIALASTTAIIARSTAQVIPTSPSTNQKSSASDQTPQREPQPDDPLAVFRAPLLREGSHLIEAKAIIKRDPVSNAWMLIINPENQSSLSYELILLPCTRLAEMNRIVEAGPDHNVTFQVTGQVFVYRGRNYLLPTHAPMVEHQYVHTTANGNNGAASQPSTTNDDRLAANPAADDVPSAPATRSAESAQDIIRDLESAAGPLARRAGPQPNDPENPPSIEDADEPDPEQQRSHTTSPPAERLLREDTAITARRGKLARDSAGGWLFIFDADASGLADPPVKLLPCLLLEKLEEHARMQGHNSPLLLSGAVYLYQGRNYLLPTVFRVAHDRPNLTP